MGKSTEWQDFGHAYPPGVTSDMIPGNRPEDEEVDFTITLTKGELEELQAQDLDPTYLHPVIMDIVAQILGDE